MTYRRLCRADPYLKGLGESLVPELECHVVTRAVAHECYSLEACLFLQGLDALNDLLFAQTKDEETLLALLDASKILSANDGKQASE